MAPKVSVILPVYNRPDSLGDACRSVLDQSYEALELIVVDDASEIDPAETIAALGDPRVRLLRREKNGGAAAARNSGLEAATGSLIAFQDSDDLWLPGRLARQVALLESMPPEIGVVMGGKILYGSNGQGRYGHGIVTYSPRPGRLLSTQEDQVKRTIRENRLSVQNALFRRDCYPETIWFDPRARANEDWEFALRLVQHTKIHEDIEPVLLAFASTDSISSNPRKKVTGHLRVIKKNRHLAGTYPKVYGRSLYTLGRGLSNVGKRRVGRRLMLKGIRECPEILGYLAQTAVTRSLAKLRRLILRR